MEIQSFKTLIESTLLMEASKKSGYNDEHATAHAWNFLVNHPNAGKLVSAPDASALKAEIRKAIADPKSDLHPNSENVSAGWKGGDKSSVEGYKAEMDKAAEVVHSLANHPSFKGAVKKKSRASVAGSGKSPLSDTWKKHGSRDNSATATSKADVVIGKESDGKHFHTISLKKGDSQLFSGQTQEVNAIYDHATTMHIKASKSGKGPKFTEADKQSVMSRVAKVSKMLSKMKTPDRKKQLTLKTSAQKIIDGIHAEHPGLLAHIHFEAATGQGKFKNQGSARHLVTAYTHTSGAHVHDTVTGHEPIVAEHPRISLPKSSSSKPGSRPGAMRIDYKVVKGAKKEKSKKKK